jgi:phospholipase C
VQDRLVRRVRHAPFGRFLPVLSLATALLALGAVAAFAATSATKPVNTGLPVISDDQLHSPPQVADTLSATTGTWNSSQTPSVTFRWRRCNASGTSCSNISGATNQAYTIVSADSGKTLRIVVTATNTAGSTTATSAATAVVFGPPRNTALPTIDDVAPTLGDTLTASDGSWSPDPTQYPTTYAFQWRRCNASGGSCSNITGAKSQTYTVVAADSGKTIRVTVVATNAAGAGSATSLATGVVQGVPTASSPPVISDAANSPPHVGDTLSTTGGTWSDPSAQLGYQWRRCNSTGSACSNIGGATQASYQAAALDAGETLRVVVTATNGYGAGTATSAPTGIVVGPPANLVAPSIVDMAGNSPPRQDDTLSVNPGTWTESPTGYSYAWEDCDASGANCVPNGFAGSTYTIQQSDDGFTIRALVTASGTDGSSTVSSLRTEIVGVANGTGPIRHIVVVYQENHSFDNVLGRLCVEDQRCDGTEVATLADGTFPLQQATDVVPSVDHSVAGQVLAADGGKMDQFDQLTGCRATDAPAYGCLTQFEPSQIPNVAALARSYVISDETFSEDLSPSWGAHLELVTGTLDGFTGANPQVTSLHAPGPGWGCDSYKVTYWRETPTAGTQLVPSCVPFPDGTGAFEPTSVPWVPTIMDRLDAAGLTWRIYATHEPSSAPAGDLPYGWAICPTFADCLDTDQAQNMVDSSQVIADAKDDALPNLSLVMPTNPNSQHNDDSMAEGDNWIGSIVSAIQSSPEWDSTAIFVTWDDCGCFYDHVAPPPGSGLGIRVPMIIVSPYAVPGYTDSNVASFASVLAFTEHTFDLAPLGSADENAYDYSASFDYTQAPQPPAFHDTQTPIPKAERQWLQAHPADPNDPT